MIDIKEIFIYHITHLKNLSKILRSECLWCDNETAQQTLNVVGIAHDHIKKRRQKCAVPFENRGFVADYVPFYFAPRSPMLSAIHNGRVENYSEGQSQVIHLVSKVEKVLEAGLPFVFTEGQADMATTRFFENPQDFDKIDWEIMKDRYWADTDEDGDRSRRRKAEFLVHNSFPVQLINGIAVISEAVKIQVEGTLKKTGIEMNVVVRRNWYY